MSSSCSPDEPRLAGASEPPPGKKFPCVKCGARLDFDPKARSLACPYCGHREEIEAGQTEAIERDLEEFLSRQSGDTIVAGHACEVKCVTCNAVVLLEDRVAAGSCPYCNTFLENQPEAARAMVAPEWLLPFAVDSKGASAAFDRWLGGLWFAPNALQALAVPGRFRGVYVPFWTFDSWTVTFYQGERGDDYQETEYYTDTETYFEGGQTKTRQVTKSRTVTKTRWHPVSGEVRHFFDDVTVCGSASLPASYAATLSVKERKYLEPFKPEFLSGFVTERYTVGPKEAFDRAKALMDPEIRRLCCQDIGGDHQRLHSVRTQHLGVTFKHVLMPVWMAAYQFRDRTYRIQVNGQTGRVTGDRPYSWAKIAALVLVIVAVIVAIALLVRAASGASGAERSTLLPPLRANWPVQANGDAVGCRALDTPSPLAGEGWGGGARKIPPHANPFPQGGKEQNGHASAGSLPSVHGPASFWYSGGSTTLPVSPAFQPIT